MQEKLTALTRTGKSAALLIRDVSESKKYGNMIGESSYWKEEVLRQAVTLKKKIEQQRWSDRSYAQLEKTVMLGFYAIRKLIEAKKLTIDVIQSHLPLISFPSLGKTVTLLNWHKFDRLYDFSHPNEQKRSLPWLCNIFVHSYIFAPAFNDQLRLQGLFFNSDFNRNKALYFVDIADVIRLFESVGNDIANYAEKVRMDNMKGDFEVVLRYKPETE